MVPSLSRLASWCVSYRKLPLARHIECPRYPSL
jgi:hypothetical protein